MESLGLCAENSHHLQMRHCNKDVLLRERAELGMTHLCGMSPDRGTILEMLQNSRSNLCVLQASDVCSSTLMIPNTRCHTSQSYPTHWCQCSCADGVQTSSSGIGGVGGASASQQEVSKNVFLNFFNLPLSLAVHLPIGLLLYV